MSARKSWRAAEPSRLFLPPKTEPQGFLHGRRPLAVPGPPALAGRPSRLARDPSV
jgi:hypothetical protein